MESVQYQNEDGKLQEKKPPPEENGHAPQAAKAAAPKEEDAEAWRHADPYAFFPAPSENNKVTMPLGRQAACEEVSFVATCNNAISRQNRGRSR